MLTAPGARADEWRQADTARQAVATVLLVADWGQTLYIADHPDQFYERNQIIGDHPSRSRVNIYFALATVGAYAVARALPPDVRPYFQYLVIGIEAGYVGHNLSIGIGFDF